MDRLPHDNILIYLSPSAANWVAGVLAKTGYCTVGVSTEHDLQEALKTDRFKLVVTIRHDIDVVRSIRALPVVNLEIFFHTNKQGPENKKFDTNAFLHRIKALLENTHLERRSQNHQPIPSTYRADWSALLWRLWLMPRRKS